jgi:hypothetical protein
MSYVRRFNTKFGKTIPQNVLDVINDQMSDALAAANNGIPMTAFVEFNKARPTDPHFPCVTVYRRSTTNIDVPDANVRSTAEFAVEIAIEGPNEDDVMQELETRVEAVDSIIRSDIEANGPRLILAGVDGPAIVEIPEHVYGANEPTGEKHIRAAALTLTVAMMEF